MIYIEVELHYVCDQCELEVTKVTKVHVSYLHNEVSLDEPTYAQRPDGWDKFVREEKIMGGVTRTFTYLYCGVCFVIHQDMLDGDKVACQVWHDRKGENKR